MSASLQLTRHREAILSVIRTSEKHLSAQEIYDLVRQQLPGTAYGTVYNALTYLLEMNLVQAINLDSGPVLYDRHTDRHDHLRCRQCGKVLDYQLPELEQALQRVAKETGFEIEKAHVIFVGLCPECRRERAAV